MNGLPGLPKATRQLNDALTSAKVLQRAGLLRPFGPEVALKVGSAVLHQGLSPAAAYGYGAARFPDELAVIDERGTLTFAEEAARVSSVTAGLKARGIGPNDRVGVLCRNHRYLIETVAGLAGTGADVLLLNVSFAGAELRQVLSDQGASALVYDEEFSEAVDAVKGLRRFVAWSEGDVADDHLEALAEEHASPGLGAGLLRGGQSHFVILTSGTTGRPKGTSRSTPSRLTPLVAILERLPLQSRDTTLIAAPLFHAWGFAQLGLSMVLSSTVVLQRRFEPEAVLRAVAQHRVRVLIVVPVMLRRLLEVDEATRRSLDLSSLACVATSGSALPGALATEFMDAFGDVIYNLYGTTEAAMATAATPSDLRADPVTAGRPLVGSEVSIVDDQGRRVAQGSTGRIVVRNNLLSTGDGGRRPLEDGFLPTGDVGHFDTQGRLYVDGRDDDMIVSGGENVYPREVEELLHTHPAIAEVAVVGVDDPEWGQRLAAFVVRGGGEKLSADQVRAFVRKHLARFKVPRDVHFVDALPRNETGKVLRRAMVDGAKKG